MKRHIKFFFISSFALLVLSSCHESLEKRAWREAREYTEQCCPTPELRNSRTDSVVFDIPTKTYTYYSTLTGDLDNAAIISRNSKEITENLRQSICNNTNIRKYKEAGFNFAYIIHSQKEPTKTLFKSLFTPKDYNK